MYSIRVVQLSDKYYGSRGRLEIKIPRLESPVICLQPLCKSSPKASVWPTHYIMTGTRSPLWWHFCCPRNFLLRVYSLKCHVSRILPAEIWPYPPLAGKTLQRAWYEGPDHNGYKKGPDQMGDKMRPDHRGGSGGHDYRGVTMGLDQLFERADWY